MDNRLVPIAEAGFDHRVSSRCPAGLSSSGAAPFTESDERWGVACDVENRGDGLPELLADPLAA